jgi:hypothetical protein
MRTVQFTLRGINITLFDWPVINASSQKKVWIRSGLRSSQFDPRISLSCDLFPRFLASNPFVNGCLVMLVWISCFVIQVRCRMEALIRQFLIECFKLSGIPIGIIFGGMNIIICGGNVSNRTVQNARICLISSSICDDQLSQRRTAGNSPRSGEVVAVTPFVTAAHPATSFVTVYVNGLWSPGGKTPISEHSHSIFGTRIFENSGHISGKSQFLN